MKVPFIDLTRIEAGLHERWLEKVDSMSRAAQFIGGAEVARLEARLSEFSGVRHVVGCANGTDALQLALRAVGVGAGDTVLVPNATFWATFEAVVNVGASPATVDISIVDGAMDKEALRTGLKKLRPRAVILVHLYGWGSAQLAEIRRLCREEGTTLIEDGAQSFGTRIGDSSIFCGAQVATTSFYPAKVLGAAGDAGALFTNDADIAQRATQLANHGRSSHYGHACVGWNSRLDALQAAYLNLALDVIDARLASRRAIARVYREALTPMGLTTLGPPDGYLENGYCNVCLVRDPASKARLHAILQARSIGFGTIYPGVMSAQPGAANLTRGHFGGTQAQELCSAVVNLPLFAYMTSAETDYVLDAVQDWSLHEQH